VRDARVAPALAHEPRIRDAAEAARIHGERLAGGELDLALQQLVAAAGAQEVFAGTKPKRPADAARRDLAHHRAVGAACDDEEAEARGQVQHAERRWLHAREHELTLAAQIILEGGVLGARKGATGVAQGRVVGVSIGFFEHDLPVAVGVGRAEQPGDESVREEGTAQLV
jgi:hypothetical protein